MRPASRLGLRGSATAGRGNRLYRAGGFGDSLSAIRFSPGLAGAGTAILTGLIARELGGPQAAAVAPELQIGSTSRPTALRCHVGRTCAKRAVRLPVISRPDLRRAPLQ